MATKLTRDHHLLSRNLKLNGNYISNDGDDEGISIANDGDVTMTSNDTHLKLAYDGSNHTTMAIASNGAATITATGGTQSNADIGFLAGDGAGAVEFKCNTATFYKSATGLQSIAMNVSGEPLMIFNSSADGGDDLRIGVGAAGASNITTIDDDGEAADLTLNIDGDTIINRDTARTTSGTVKGLHIDYDHTGISASGQSIVAIGLDLDMNCETVTHVGTVKQTGIDLDMVAAGDGALQEQVGLDIKCTGGDYNRGLRIEVPDGNNDYHILLVAADDTSEYAKIRLAETGDLTIETVGDGTTDSDLTLDVDGDIVLDADGGNIYFKDNGTTYIDFQVDGSNDKMAVTGALTIDASDKIVLDSASGGFEMHGAGTTAKFADMYAGMILGYTAINIDAIQESYAVTGSLAVTDANHKVIFVAPPSGKVEIFVSFSAIAIAQRWLKLGLSNNATYQAIQFPNLGDPTNEHTIIDLPVDGYARVITHNWVVEGLTAGTEYTWYLGAQAEQAARITMWWGGTASGRYAPFIMKATALPATITTE